MLSSIAQMCAISQGVARLAKAAAANPGNDLIPKCQVVSSVCLVIPRSSSHLHAHT